MSLGDVKIYSGLGSGSIEDFSGAWYTTFVTNLLADFQKFQQDVINNVTYSADLSSYALITYVDEAVANVTVDLTGYATELYVTQALENFDLSAYATTQYVDAAIAALGYDNHTHEALENRVAELEAELNPTSDMLGVVADDFSAYGQDPHWYIIARTSKVDPESTGVAGPAVIRATTNADRSDYFYNFNLMPAWEVPGNLENVVPHYNRRGKVLGGYMGKEYTVTVPTSQSIDHIYVSGGQLSAPYFTFSDGNGSDIDLASFEFEAGKSYTFTAAEGFTPHPFEIGSTPGTVSTYSSGGPLSAVGDSLVLDIPTSFDSSTESLYFYCTAHTSMNGQLTVVASEPEVFLLDGSELTNLEFFEGSTYVFDWSADLTKPLKLSTTQDGENNGGVEFTDGVVRDNELGTTTITIPLGLGTDLYFYGDSSNMGGKLLVLNPLNTDYVDSSDKINSNLLDTLSSNRTTKTNKVLLIVDTCLGHDYQYWAGYSLYYYYWKYLAKHKGITLEIPGIDGSLPLLDSVSLYNGLNAGVGPTVSYAKFHNEFGGQIDHRQFFERTIPKDEWLSYLDQYDSVIFYGLNKFPFFSETFKSALVEYRDTGGGLYFNAGWRYYIRAINPLIKVFGAQYAGGPFHSRQTPSPDNNTGLHDYSKSPAHTQVGFLKTSGYGLQSLWTNIDNEAHVYGGSNDPYIIADINEDSAAAALEADRSFLDLVDTPSAFDPNKPFLRKVPDDEGGALEFVSENYIVDRENRNLLSLLLFHRPTLDVTAGEELDIIAINKNQIVYRSENNVYRYLSISDEYNSESGKDVYIRIDNGEPVCTNGGDYDPETNSCFKGAGEQGWAPVDKGSYVDYDTGVYLTGSQLSDGTLGYTYTTYYGFLFDSNIVENPWPGMVYTRYLVNNEDGYWAEGFYDSNFSTTREATDFSGLVVMCYTYGDGKRYIAWGVKSDIKNNFPDSTDSDYVSPWYLPSTRGLVPNSVELSEYLNTEGRRFDFVESQNWGTPYGNNTSDLVQPEDLTFRGAYDPSKARNASGGYGYSARVRILKSGPYARGFIDVHKLFDDVQKNKTDVDTNNQSIANLQSDVAVLQSAGSGVSGGTFTTADLPLASPSASLALVTDASPEGTQTMGYFYEGKWYRTLDNVLIKDQTVDIYLQAGQSNAHGWGAVSTLTEEQKTQDGIFYTSWNDSTSNASSTQYYSSWASSLVAGSTRGDNQTSTLGNSIYFGPEIGFMAKANELSLAGGRPIGILKYAIGASSITDRDLVNYNGTVYRCIETHQNLYVGGANYQSTSVTEPEVGSSWELYWQVDTESTTANLWAAGSYEDNGRSDWDIDAVGDKAGDALRGFKLAIADGVEKLKAQGYGFRLRGLIWWQGESGGDADKLTRFIDHVRTWLFDNNYIEIPKNEFAVTLTGTTTYWGPYIKSVADSDPYVGFVNSQDLAAPEGADRTLVHPGADTEKYEADADDVAAGIATEVGELIGHWDYNDDGLNDMYAIGRAHAEQMAKAISGEAALESPTTGPKNANSFIVAPTTGPKNIDPVLQQVDWQPSDTTTEFWLDASDTSTITESGENITQIVSKTGNMTYLPGSSSTVVSTPNAIGSRNALVFNGDADYIQANATITTPSATQDWYVVAKPIINHGQDSIWSTTGALSNTLIPLGNTGTRYFKWFYAGSPVSSSLASVDQSGVLGMYCIRWDTTNQQISTWFNGNQVDNATTPSVTIDMHSRSLTLRHMAQYGNSVLTDGTFCESIITTSTADREKYEGYLAHKWGLESLLPSGHPYKSTAPHV